MTRILYIDDESALLTLTRIYLKEEADLDVDTSSSPVEGLKMLRESSYDAIISDYDMPEIDGIEFLKQVREYDCSIPFIVFTGKGREEVAIEALNHGADFYIQKEGDPRTIFTELSNAINHLVRRNHAERNATLTEQQLSAFLDSLTDLAFIKGPDLTLVYGNHAYLAFLDKGPLEMVVGRSDEALLPPGLVASCRRSDEAVIESRRALISEEKAGNRTFHVQKFPLPFPGGKTGVGGIIHEISRG